MERTDIVIIGAGAVGLAIAERLSAASRETVVLERHDSFGRETSSRNSEVIHAGFYYPSGSLKAELCVAGNPLLYEFCGQNGVPHRRCGKLVVARTPEEERKVHHLFEQGLSNGVTGMELVDAARIREQEPAIACTMGLWSPATGIFDTHTFMKRLEQRASAAGATLAYHCEVSGISRTYRGYEIRVQDADGSYLRLESAQVINSAGLSADRIAAMIGIDIDRAGYRIHYCKGEYFAVSGRHRGKLSHLVYPAPTPISLGIHSVLGLDGSLRLGPSAFFVDELNYDVDAAHLREFFDAAHPLFPFLEERDLTPDMAGIRPKLRHGGETFHDFVIREENDRGLPGFINCIGIESPGLTASLAIARYVEKLAL